MFKILIALAFGVCIFVAESPSKSTAPAGKPHYTNAPNTPEKEDIVVTASKITVENIGITETSYGTVILADFSVVNRSHLTVKDFVVTLWCHGNSGTTFARHDKRLFEVLRPGEALDFKAINMGFKRQQTATYSGSITDFAIIQ